MGLEGQDAYKIVSTPPPPNHRLLPGSARFREHEPLAFFTPLMHHLAAEPSLFAFDDAGDEGGEGTVDTGPRLMQT